MKKSLLLAALLIMIIAAGCTKKDPLDPNTYVGKYHVVSNGSLSYSDQDGKSQTIPVVLYDTVNIALDPNNSLGLICTGKIFKGNVTVTENGIKFDELAYTNEGEGIAYSYGLNLTITNDYATVDALGVLSWKSTVTGTATGSTIGIGVEQKVTGTLTNIGAKKI